MSNSLNVPPKSVNKIVIPLFIVVWLSMIGVAVFGLTALINPGKLDSSENAVNQSVSKVPQPPTELELPEITEETQKAGLSFLTLMMLLIACSGGSLLVTFALKYLVTSKPKKLTIKNKKRVNNIRVTDSKKVKKRPINKQIIPEKPVIKDTINQEPIVTVIAPQESTPVEVRSPTLAETLDLRKRRSLISMMQDN